MVFAPLALALLVLGIGANHHNAAFALDDFALFANGLNGRSDFHFQIPPCTFPVGQIGEEAKKLLDVTQKSLYLGIEAAQAGHRVGDIGAAVQALVEQNGFAVVRQYVGHGVGHNLHEDPEIPNFGRAGHGVRLVPGMTIAIEPMVNQAGEGVRVLDNDWTVVTRSGSLSAHFEHTIAITEQGPVILTTP